MNRTEAAPRLITGLASGLTVTLTAAAFWLSYAHLHQVAAGHGLGHEEIRSWAWPATIDLFIAIGELLTLRASLMRRVDWGAIGLTVIGSGGSIALNVAGVGAGASMLDYVVAAVPPVAALLAFGALMRQVHGFLSGRAPEHVSDCSPASNEHEQADLSNEQERAASTASEHEQASISTRGPVAQDERQEASTSNEHEQPRQASEPTSTPPVLVLDEREHERPSTPPPVPARARATSTAPAARPRAVRPPVLAREHNASNLAQLARELLGEGASNEQASARIIERMPSAKPDSVKAAVRRERRALIRFPHVTA
ncbi:DUF2637 domain-containing protein [Streptomyces mirabilis]|uniref:DUF2637 domain-containing protein n=1 Tax=Streptomyces mirabilis TaxID=68239 RepID=UPI003647FFD1